VLYRLLRPLIYLLPAETAHRLGIWFLAALSRSALGRALPGALYGRPDPRLRTEVMGLSLPSPIGLAAGLDKDAEAYPALLALGFGAVEIGTVTAKPQPGNPRPRLFRLPADRALVNRMGFNNHGCEAAAARLAGRGGDGVVGVNIGKTKVVPAEQAAADYAESTRRLAPLADYLVVNVSSPNTPGLRDLQAVASLRPLLETVQGELQAVTQGAPRRVPLLVKIAPDLADEDIDAVADLALELGLDGIIATNTTIGRAGLSSPEARVERCGTGGLSGAPLCERSFEVLRRLRQRVGTGLTLVSVGGIDSAEEAYRRLEAGATLVQLYTALIYAGPGLPARLNRELCDLIAARGWPPGHPMAG